jgi:hypothetical protein
MSLIVGDVYKILFISYAICTFAIPNILVKKNITEIIICYAWETCIIKSCTKIKAVHKRIHRLKKYQSPGIVLFYVS